MPSLRTFLPLASNENARARMLRWATEYGGAGSPAVLVGRTNVGKTHLAVAVGSVREPARLPIIVSAAELVAGAMAALREGRILEYRAHIRARPGCLVLEHMEDLENKRATLAEVFTMIAPLVEEQRVILTITQRDRSMTMARTIQRAFPKTVIARIGLPTPKERREVARVMGARRTAAAEAAPVSADAIIARLLSDLPEEDVSRDRVRRLLLVLDPDLSALARPLQDADFAVLCSQPLQGDHAAGYLRCRVAVTRRTEPLLEEASAWTLGIIGLDAILLDAEPSMNAARAAVKVISAAVTAFHVSRRRDAWVLLLHPEGRHVFRALE